MPNAPAEFFYTVQAYEINKVNKESDYAANVVDIKGAQFTKSKSVWIDSTVIYRVTVKYRATPTSTPITISSEGTNVSGYGDVLSRSLSTGAFATFKTSVDKIASVSGIRTINDVFYDFTITPKGISGTVDPKVNVQVRINGIWADVVTQVGTTPGSIFTKKNAAPQVPLIVKSPDEGSIFGADPEYEWDSCNKRWVRIWLSDVVQLDPVGDEIGRIAAKFEVFISVKYFDEFGFQKGPDKYLTTSGVKKHPKAVLKVKDLNITRGDKKAGETGWTRAKAELQKAKNKNCGSVPDNTTPPDDGSRSAAVPKGTSLYNPYPHVVTRNYKEIAEWPSDQYDSKVKNLDQLGVMYTDPQLASYTKVEGTNEYKVDTTRSAIKNQWGFRFLYNPTTWNYSFGADNSGIDWGRGNPNNTILVAGTGTISLQLLIDRVADMNTVRYWDRNGRTNPVGLPYYPVTLTEEQCAGLLYRGTEYDLEYLFRVLNNNLSENPMFGTAGTATSATKGLETLSANLGYVTSLPFMLKFNDQLRYKVVLTGLSVNHDIFTKEMIPTRTVVNLQLERIPDFFFDQKGDKEKRLRFDKETLLKGIYDSSAASKYVGPSRIQPLPGRRDPDGMRYE
jgi:hypothetical protein